MGEIAQALYRLNKDALTAFAPLLEQAGAGHLIRRNGRLDVYQSERVFAKAQVKFDLLRRCGVRVEMLDHKGVRDLEPALADRCRQGVFYPESAHTTSPLRLTRLLAEDFVRRGGRLLRERVTDFRMGSEGVWSVVTDGGRHPADQLVLAAGAYSRPLAAKLGSRLPLEAERGYHLMLPQAGIELQRTVVHGDRYFGLTPMEGGMRLAGTVELASVHAKSELRPGRRPFPGRPARPALPERPGGRPLDGLPAVHARFPAGAGPVSGSPLGLFRLRPRPPWTHRRRRLRPDHCRSGGPAGGGQPVRSLSRRPVLGLLDRDQQVEV